MVLLRDVDLCLCTLGWSCSQFQLITGYLSHISIYTDNCTNYFPTLREVQIIRSPNWDFLVIVVTIDEEDENL